MIYTIEYTPYYGRNAIYAKITSKQQEWLHDTLIAFTGGLMENMQHLTEEQQDFILTPKKRRNIYSKQQTKNTPNKAEQSPFNFVGGIVKQIPVKYNGGYRDFTVSQLNKLLDIFAVFKDYEWCNEFAITNLDHVKKQKQRESSTLHNCSLFIAK